MLLQVETDRNCSDQTRALAVTALEAIGAKPAACPSPFSRARRSAEHIARYSCELSSRRAVGQGRVRPVVLALLRSMAFLGEFVLSNCPAELAPIEVGDGTRESERSTIPLPDVCIHPTRTCTLHQVPVCSSTLEPMVKRQPAYWGILLAFSGVNVE